MTEPIPAVRAKPGEFFLAAETITVGDRFQAGDAVYEVASEPTKWGAAWVANVIIIEGFKPGGMLRAMLHLGRKVEG